MNKRNFHLRTETYHKVLRRRRKVFLGGVIMDTVSFKDLPMSNLVPERVYLSGDTGNYTRDESIQRDFQIRWIQGNR